MSRFVQLFTALLVVVMFSGCASGGSKVMERPRWSHESIEPEMSFAGHQLYAGGVALDERQLCHAIDWADVILVGESHDSETDHAFQYEFFEYLLKNRDGMALSLEFLDRSEQKYTDAYLNGEMDLDVFMEKTGAKKGDDNSWEKWYQPLVDLAKQHDRQVIAANAPRQYSSLVWKEGLGALDQLSAEEQLFFAEPMETEDTAYYNRFLEAVADHDGLDEEMLRKMYVAQQLWDSTMAVSILKGLESSEKVVHLVGRFHIEDDGGTVLQLLARRPGLRVLTISSGEAEGYSKADILVVQIAPSGI